MSSASASGDSAEVKLRPERARKQRGASKLMSFNESDLYDAEEEEEKEVEGTEEDAGNNTAMEQTSRDGPAPPQQDSAADSAADQQSHAHDKAETAAQPPQDHPSLRHQPALLEECDAAVDALYTLGTNSGPSSVRSSRASGVSSEYITPSRLLGQSVPGGALAPPRPVKPRLLRASTEEMNKPLPPLPGEDNAARGESEQPPPTASSAPLASAGGVYEEEEYEFVDTSVKPQRVWTASTAAASSDGAGSSGSGGGKPLPDYTPMDLRPQAREAPPRTKQPPIYTLGSIGPNTGDSDMYEVMDDERAQALAEQAAVLEDYEVIDSPPPLPRRLPGLPARHPSYEINPLRLERTGKLLGKGFFAQVEEGRLQAEHAPNTTTLVAIKTLRKGSPPDFEREFLIEADLMVKLKPEPHPNVLSLVGLVTQFQPYQILVEHCGLGNLRSVLRRARPKPQLPGPLSPGTDPAAAAGAVPPAATPELTTAALIEFARQVAAGMAFLAGKGIVHRDLAARNVLVTNQHVAKIGDFGLSRDPEDGIYVKMNPKNVPYKWMSIERLTAGINSTEGDVWAFGVVIWEIFTLGETPYPVISNIELLEHLKLGMRPPKPDLAPQAVHMLMLDCMKEHPRDRPLFPELALALAQMGEEGCRSPSTARFGQRLRLNSAVNFLSKKLQRVGSALGLGRRLVVANDVRAGVLMQVAGGSIAVADVEVILAKLETGQLAMPADGSPAAIAAVITEYKEGLKEKEEKEREKERVGKGEEKVREESEEGKEVEEGGEVEEEEEEVEEEEEEGEEEGEQEGEHDGNEKADHGAREAEESQPEADGDNGACAESEGGVDQGVEDSSARASPEAVAHAAAGEEGGGDKEAEAEPSDRPDSPVPVRQSEE